MFPLGSFTHTLVLGLQQVTPGQSSLVLHWGVEVGLDVAVVVVVLLGGIPQIVSLGSFTHWLVLRLQQVTPGQSSSVLH